MMRTLFPGLGALWLLACSTIGDPAGLPDQLPHGGTGQFRPLQRSELGIVGEPEGRALFLQANAVGPSMVAAGHLFYTHALIRADAPEPPADWSAGDVFWPAFEPRVISRATPRENPGFDRGTQILEASAAWEGDAVFDPWVWVEPDGSVKLYYASSGGIGLATADNIDGSFSRVGNDAILALGLRGEVPRRPSVTRDTTGTYWMYYTDGAGISVARSDDGLQFISDANPDLEGTQTFTLTGDDDLDSNEVQVQDPGVVGVITPAGRFVIRMYFESLRADGSRAILVAGSEDGYTFERYSLRVLPGDDLRAPAPVFVDPRVSLLYYSAPTGMATESRAIAVAVTPAGTRYDEMPEDSENTE